MNSSGTTGMVVNVHPLTLLSVIDHHRRSHASKVVGALLGTTHAGTLSLTNSFAVPFDQDPLDARASFLDHNYMEAMVDLSKKVSAKERLLGWYKAYIPPQHETVMGVDEADRQLAARLSAAYGASVLVVVDASGHRSPQAFVYKGEEGVLVPLPCALEAEEAELVGVEHLLRDVSDAPAGMLSTQITRKLDALRSLDGQLGDLERSIESQVQDGELDQEMLAQVQELVNQLGGGGHKTQEEKVEEVTDQLAMTLVSSLSRCVIALHDLINNNHAVNAGSAIPSGNDVPSKQ